MYTHFNLSTFEAMGTRIVGVEDEMYRNKVEIVDDRLMKRAGLVEAVLQTVYVRRYEGVAR